MGVGDMLPPSLQSRAFDNVDITFLREADSTRTDHDKIYIYIQSTQAYLHWRCSFPSNSQPHTLLLWLWHFVVIYDQFMVAACPNETKNLKLGGLELMICLIASPGHQQATYRLQWLGVSLTSMDVLRNYKIHICQRETMVVYLEGESPGSKASQCLHAIIFQCNSCCEAFKPFDIAGSRCESSRVYIRFTWWRHQMKTSALLVFCERNPPITGGFPSQRPVTRSLDVYFLYVFEQMVEQTTEMPWRSLWRHCNDMCSTLQGKGTRLSLCHVWCGLVPVNFTHSP